MEDHTSTSPLLDLSHAAPDIISIVLRSMPLRDRFTCALVCKAWAEAATAVTHSIVLKHKMQDLSGLQCWMEKHGNQVAVLQLHECNRAAQTALPCCAKLQDLLLHHVDIGSRTWGDIAAATKLTSITLDFVLTASRQADVVAALTALPNLEQLTWCVVRCNDSVFGQNLSDSSLLQQTTRLTSLKLLCITAVALQHLGSLTKLQHLSISDADDWAAAGCPGLQELKALTSLKLLNWVESDLPASVSQLTALRQLEVHRATPTALNQLQVFLPNSTWICVGRLTGPSPEPLRLSGLQHLELLGIHLKANTPMPTSFLASCTQLRFLRLHGCNLNGPGSLVASTMLQQLELYNCSIAAADGAADRVSWQQVFSGPGQLPHLTSLQLSHVQPTLQQADIQAVVACCSSLKMLDCNTLPSGCVPALAQLPGLTHLQLRCASDDDCITLVQVTGLRQLMLTDALELSVVGLRQLAALSQLTSLGFGRFGRSPLDTLAPHVMKDKLPGCHNAIVNKAPSGFPPDVSPRLLDICNVMDAREG